MWRPQVLLSTAAFAASPVLGALQKSTMPAWWISGAGEGNRTLVVSLEGFCSTIELHPPISRGPGAFAIGPAAASMVSRRPAMRESRPKR